MSFCKASGRLNFSETKLKNSLLHVNCFKNMEMEDIEESYFRS